MDEYKMLIQMIISKKKENYKMLKEWDDKRVKDHSLHLTVVEELERALDTQARISFENLEIYLSTFREIANQHVG